jgi:hypothetical protein
VFSKNACAVLALVTGTSAFKNVCITVFPYSGAKVFKSFLILKISSVFLTGADCAF